MQIPTEAVAAVEALAARYFGILGVNAVASHESFSPGPHEVEDAWSGYGLEWSSQGQKLVIYADPKSKLPVSPEILIAAKELGDLNKLQLEIRDTGAYRPLSGTVASGVSIGATYSDPNLGQATGTLGAVVRLNGDLHLLSCNHVIYFNGEVGTGNDADVLQPARNGTVIGRTVDIAGLKLLSKDPADPSRDFNNPGDWALAKLTSQAAVPNWWTIQPAISRSTPIPGVSSVGRKVIMLGGVSGPKAGTVIGPKQGFRMRYRELNARYGFAEQLRVRGDGGNPFATDGDSGALVVTDSGEPVGLVFATNGGDTMVCPLEPLFRKLPGLQLAI